MEIRQLRYFEAVASTLNFSRFMQIINAGDFLADEALQALV